MSGESPSVLYSVSNSIATITLNRPESLNPLGPAQFPPITDAIRMASEDGSVRAVVFTGAGKAFSAGGDVKTMEARLAQPVVERWNYLSEISQVVMGLVNCPKPTIAVIRGACVGAGLSIAAACDIRVASNTAKFGAVFTKIGLASDLALSYFLPKLVGHAKALEMYYTGDLVLAEEAKAIGLVNRLVPDDRLDEEGAMLAGKIASGATAAFSMVKRQVYLSLESSLKATAELEAAHQTVATYSQDAREGIQAINEKRPPGFKGY